MKNQLFIILLLTLIGTHLDAQLDLILHEADPGYSANHIAEDFEGNTIVCGSKSIGKLGTDSSWIWNTLLLPAEGSPGFVVIHDMTIDGAGNIFLTGRFSYSVAFGSITLTSQGNTLDLFVSKIDPGGNFLWAKSYGTNAGTDLGEGIALDAGGNIYITGSFFNKACSGPGNNGLYVRDIYVAKLNSSGNVIWQKRFPPTKLQCPNGGSGYEVNVDGAGNVYTTGAFNGTIKFGNTSALTLTSLGNGDIFTLKLSNSGTSLWAKAGRGTAGEKSTSLYVDNAGNAIVGGYYGFNWNGSVTFSPFTLADVDGDGTSAFGIVSNAFLVKYLADGTVAWAVNPGTMAGIHNEVNGVVPKSANEIYISLPSLGIKTISLNDGQQLSFSELQDNFWNYYSWIAEKVMIRDMGASAQGYIFSLRGICGSITVDNITLANEYCSDCSVSENCDFGNHGDVFVIKSVNTPSVNAPIVNRSTPEIEGHTYLGTYEGHTYYLSNCQTTLIHAQDAAYEMGGYLAIITSQSEDEFLTPFAPPVNCESIVFNYNELNGGAWIGLIALEQSGICGYWTWWNGEQLNYTNWSTHYANSEYTDCGNATIIGPTSVSGECTIESYAWWNTWHNSPSSQYIVEFDSDPGCSNSNKTYVCHNGNTICINEGSLQNHLDHGDYEGPCSPCNATIAEMIHDVPSSIFGDGQGDILLQDNLLDGHSLFDPEFSLFPNPARDELHIQFTDVNGPAGIVIHDQVGKLIWQKELAGIEKTHRVLLDNHFPNGIYYITVISQNKIKTERFLIAR